MRELPKETGFEVAIGYIKEAAGGLLTSDFWDGDRAVVPAQEWPLSRADSLLDDACELIRNTAKDREEAMEENLKSLKWASDKIKEQREGWGTETRILRRQIQSLKKIAKDLLEAFVLVRCGEAGVDAKANNAICEARNVLGLGVPASKKSSD